jgi:hypothetical protein
LKVEAASVPRIEHGVIYWVEQDRGWSNRVSSLR